MHRKNVIKNLIIPDLNLLEESKNRIDNFKQFITAQMEVIHKLQNYIDKLWLKRANIIETVQRHLNNNLSEEQVIGSLPKKSKTLYEEYTKKIKNIKEEIETKYNNIANYKINILIPKHSGKPATGNIIYPSCTSCTLKDTEILKKAKLKTSLTDKFNINDAKLICNADVYKNSAEILNEVTELKTPISVHTANLKNIEDFINNEIEYHKNRLVEIETEQIYQYQSKVSTIESPKEEKIQQKTSNVIQSINQQKVIHHKRIVDTIKYVGKATDTFLVERGCTTTDLTVMYLRMPKQFVTKDELKNYKTIKSQISLYDFNEFDNLIEKKYEKMQYIDPKFYKLGQKFVIIYNTTRKEKIKIHNFPVYKHVYKENKKSIKKFYWASLSKGCSK